MTRRNVICVMVGALLLTGVSQVRAGVVLEVEPNDTIATAQNVDALFGVESNPNIQDSTSIPHATVRSPSNTNNNPANFDVYSFTVTQSNSLGRFDMDGLVDADGNFLAQTNFDGFLELFNALGTRIAFDDDFSTGTGFTDPGSGPVTTDPFLEFTFTDPGTYFIRAGETQNATTSNPITGGRIYSLNISVENSVVAVPEPTSLALLSVGMVTFAGGAAVRRRRKKNQATEATVCS